MDKNTITGLVLIGILLVGFSFLSRPSEEQIAAQKKYYDSIAVVQQQEEALKAKTEAHKNLGYEQSAQVVISHVTDGLKLAEKNNLPKVIKDFITTHHGRGKTKYFYISWKNEHPGEDPNEEAFTYPGPNPFTKEQAILMMADSVEAASRSLPEYTEESISNLVDKIIDSQVAEGYFKECPITFKDIATVKNVFKEKLKTIYHTRISYPELKK